MGHGRRTAIRAAWAGLAAVGLLSFSTSAQQATRGPSSPGASLAGVTFERDVTPFPVVDADGRPHALPFLGGLDVPRPQFADIDGDGDLDLFVQEYSNTLWFFENTGSSAAPAYTWRTDRFQDVEIGEWYRFVDINGDGLIDLLSELPNSHIRYYRNTGTKTAPKLDFVGPLPDASGEPIFLDRQNIPAIVDIDCDGRLDLFVGRVEGVVDRYEAVDPNAEQFAFVTDFFEGISIVGRVGGLTDRPTMRHGANALAFADFEGDGDFDLFWGDFFEPAVLLIENIGRTCSNPSFEVDPIVLPYAADTATSGYNAPAPVDLDGDGDMDFLLGVLGGAFNPIGTAEGNFFYWERTAADRFDLRTKRFLDGIDVGSDSVPALADLDGDGDLDLVIGNRIDATDGDAGRLAFFTNEGTPTAPRFRRGETLAFAGAYNLAPAFGDLDGDGDLDLLLGTWNQDVLFVRNDGTAREARWVIDEAATITPPRMSHASPTLGDVDGDGDLDLFLGQANGAFAFYRNTGTPKAPRFELVSDRLDEVRAGRRSAPALVDLDGDGRLDIVSGREETGMVSYRNVSSATEPKLVAHPGFALDVPPGSAPAFGDLTGDGVPDLVVGTTSGGVRFYRGTPGS